MNFINDTIIKAVSWTLIHSLWLGMLLAIVTGISLLFTRKQTAAFRYNLLAGLSVLFIISIGFAMHYELKQSSSKMAESNAVHFIEKQTGIMALNTPDTFNQTQEWDTNIIYTTTSRFLNEHAVWIVCIWLLFFSLKCFRMANGVRHIYRIRNYQTIVPSPVWTKRLSELKTTLRIQKKIKLLESRLVAVPSVTGFLKPIILVPVGLLNNLPAEQVEAILLHELAHIRRSDYAVNILQGFMEIIFFFNPAVLWISSLLRDERENCCDDLAIGVTQNKKAFVNALISFQEYNLSGQTLAVQFGSKKMHLSNRVKRILFNHHQLFNTVEKCFLSVCILAGVVICFAFSNMDALPSHLKNNFKSAATLPPDSLKRVSDTLYANRTYDPASIPEGTSLRFDDLIKGKQHTTYLFKHEGILYQAPENLRTIIVNGQLVSGNDRKGYLPLLQSLIENYEYQTMNNQMEIVSEAVDRITASSDFIAAQSQCITTSSEEEIRLRALNIENESKRIEAESKRIEAESVRIEAESKRIEAKSRQIAAESKRIEAENKKIEANSRNKKVETKTTERHETITNNSKDADPLTLKIIQDIRKYGYNGNQSKVSSFELSEDRLIVNNVKQSDELLKKLKKHLQAGMKITYLVTED